MTALTRSAAIATAAPRLVVFPGAGSFGGEFTPLQRALGRRSTRVRYPGRHDDELAASFDDLVLRCADQVRTPDATGVVLLGHSFGAYVAHATAVELQRTARPVTAVVVLGATPPTRLDPGGLPVGPDEEIAAYFERIDPSSVEELGSSEWRETVLDAARTDLGLLRGRGRPVPTPLTCPVVAARGSADVLASDEDLAAWAEVTTGGVTTRVFPGGHSDYLGSPAWISWVRDEVLDR